METPERIVEIIKDIRSRSSELLQVYWLTVPSNRDQLCQDLAKLLMNEPVLPIVLRLDGFTNPNAILGDLNRLIEDRRTELSEPRFANVTSQTPIVLLILSRFEFMVPQLSSPTTLPPWFPREGGNSCTVFIKDLAAKADGPLNAPEAKIGELCAALFEFDTSLARRFRAVHATDRKAAAAFQSLILPQQPKPEQFSRFLDDVDSFLGNVRNPDAYRPSQKESGCVSAHLVRIFQRSAPDDLTKAADKLKAALSLSITNPGDLYEPICSILFRPTEIERDIARRAARSIIIVVSAAYQLTTASAHADDYPRFQLTLMRGQSHDLRTSLSMFTLLLNLQ